MRYLIVAVLLVVAGAVAGYWLWPDEREKSVTPVEDTKSDLNESTLAERALSEKEMVVKENTQQTPSDEQSEEPEAAASTTEERLLEMGYTKEEIARQRKRQQLEQAAQSRFDDTVELDQLSADDVSPQVRELFTTMMFEPALNVEDGQEGYVDGLRIAELGTANPFSRAGFEVGDRLVRLNGQPLRDPAQIAHLFTALDGSFEACALRSGQEYCRRIDLPDS